MRFGCIGRRVSEDIAGIYFRELPLEFRDGECIIAAQYEIAGIQPFIFGQLSDCTEASEVRRRSRYIEWLTEQIHRYLQEKFLQNGGIRVLSQSSGKLICAFREKAGQKRISEISDQLQRIVYASSPGQLEMFYGTCRAYVTTQQVRKDASAELGISVNKNKYHCVNLLQGKQLSMRREDFSISAMHEKKDGGMREAGAKGNILMAVKLDLDNLGSFFSNLNAFDDHRAASLELAEVLAGACTEAEGTTPIFIGGDDLFLLIEPDCFFLSLCRIYTNIMEGIAQKDFIKRAAQIIGISCGCTPIRGDLTENLPLLYYYDISEKMLERAKAVPGKNAVVIDKSEHANMQYLRWDQMNCLKKGIQRIQKESVWTESGDRSYMLKTAPVVLAEYLCRRADIGIEDREKLDAIKGQFV